MSALLILKPEREKPLRNQHPWIFSGAIESHLGDPRPGELVTVVNRARQFLARGYYNPKSQILVRVLTWQDEPIDDAWWRAQLQRAIDARASVAVGPEGGLRLVNAESDYLPGLVVDRYGEWLVLQALTLGIDQRKDQITRILVDLLQPRGVFERSDVDVRGKEGLKPSVGVLWGEEPPEHIEIEENGLQFLVDVRTGHKTGFYLDQRENRQTLRDLVSNLQSPRVLNLFSYTGGFGVYALAGGAAQAVNVDSSFEALELAETAIEANQPEWLAKSEFIQANVFDYLRDQRDEGALYDVVVLDPPKFAQNAQQVEKAARGYKDLNLNAFYLIRPGGYMLTFSCSGAITIDLFQKIVFGALADAGRQAQVIRHFEASEDQPVALTFPEGAYLKGLLLRVY